VPAPGGADDGGTPPPGAGPFPPELAALSRSVKRTAPKNTRALVDALRALEDLRVSREEAFRVGMGRFPVGGYASYSHDWWLPRFGPGWRLHLGTDVFAARGTPVRAPADGVVRLTSGGLGGIATYVIQDDGTYFYLAHLDGRPPGLRDGQAVRTGDIVGYVGTSGNASGGAPHLHFEIHPAPVKVITTGRGKAKTTRVVPVRVPPGTTLPAVDPKPYLDRFLQDALADVPRLVSLYQASHNLVQASLGEFAAAPLSPDPAAITATLSNGQLTLGSPSLGRDDAPAPAPLVALAFVLLVIVGSLTPVFGPARVRVPQPGRSGRLVPPDGGLLEHADDVGEGGVGMVVEPGDTDAPEALGVVGGHHVVDQP
jgi:hypothetical protein